MAWWAGTNSEVIRELNDLFLTKLKFTCELSFVIYFLLLFIYIHNKETEHLFLAAYNAELTIVSQYILPATTFGSTTCQGKPYLALAPNSKNQGSGYTNFWSTDIARLVSHFRCTDYWFLQLWTSARYGLPRQLLLPIVVAWWNTMRKGKGPLKCRSLNSQKWWSTSHDKNLAVFPLIWGVKESPILWVTQGIAVCMF